MTNSELSNYFDTLLVGYYTSIGYNTQIVFDEFEKSLFLTEAQEDLIINYYSSNTHNFEGSEAERRALSSLVVEYKDRTPLLNPFKMCAKSYVYELQEDVWYIVYESVDWNKSDTGCHNNTDIEVVPVTHDEFHRIKNNPFRGASDSRVLRLDIQNIDINNQSVELISKYPIEFYRYRYIKKPSPIILENINTIDGLSIEGQTEYSECELPEILHKQIVQLAVQKAVQSRSIAQSKS